MVLLSRIQNWYCRYSFFIQRSCYGEKWSVDLISKLQSFSSLASVKSSLLDTNRYLGRLTKSGQVDEARKVFERMPEKDEFTWNTMVIGYADSGRLNEAKEVFDVIPIKSSITWSSLISGCCKWGNETEVFQMFGQMLEEGHKPNQFTLSSVLRICSVKSLLLQGKQIHGYALKSQFDSNVYVVTGLIDMYAKCLSVVEAESLFKMMPLCGRNHVTWTAMINGYSLNGDVLNALHCFIGMRQVGVKANHYTFPGVLTACGAVYCLKFGEQLHCCIVCGGFEPNVFVQTALVDMYAKCGDFNSAKNVLKAMDIDHVVSWNSLIVGYMRNGFEEEALSLFQAMHQRNMEMDDFTYPSIINCLTSSNHVKLAQSVHCLVVKSGFKDHMLINNALVDMYAKQGDLCFAFQLFNNMVDRDVISWTSIIVGCVHNGSHEEALKLFAEMRDTGREPDQVVISSILSCCAELALLEFGQTVHANLLKSCPWSSLSVNNSLVAMYTNCGCLEEANRVFHSMDTRNVMTWTTLIVGYAKNGKGKESLRLYDEMIESGIRPDFITFIGLLFACSHAGLVDQGHQYFQTMVNVYGINPGPDHYACMIDLLGRSGKLHEAKKLLHEMPVEPNPTVWKSFLASCKKHGDLDLAKKAASVLFQLTPQDAVPYVMLSNMYSAEGRWEDVAEMRKLMKSKCVSKEPGCSWLEMNGKLHTFISEDKSHLNTDQIYAKINDTICLIKKAGYVPDMKFALQDLNDEGKEKRLAYHSEKLAVAFCLLYAPEGIPIRIYKNLRVCGDCHSAMKFISNIFQRYIILRDSNCFHHFKDGICSCGDYY